MDSKLCVDVPMTYVHILSKFHSLNLSVVFQLCSTIFKSQKLTKRKLNLSPDLAGLVSL